jgi:hypothetical protein
MSNIVNRIKSNNYNEYIILSFILLLGFSLRLYKISNPVADWHSWRQADTASVTRIYTEEGINLLFPRYYDISSIQTGIYNPEGLRFVEFPLYNYVHALFVKNIDAFSLDTWGRLLSVFYTLMSAVFIFLIGRQYINKNGGLLASFIYLTLPYNIYFSRTILPEPMAVMFGLISLWLFIKFIDNESTAKLFMSAIVLAVALLVKPFTIFYSIPMIYLLLNKYSLKGILNNPKLVIKLLLFTDIVLIPFILWRGWENKYPQGIPYWKWAFNGDNIRFRPAFFRWIFAERLGRLILGMWGLVPFTLGLLKTRKNSLFIQSFMAGVIIYVVVFATANVKHDYYQMYLIPAISLVFASGAMYLWETKVFKKYLSRSLLIFSIFMMFGVGTYQVKEFYKINRPEIIEAGEYVDSIAGREEKVIAPYNGDTALLYQTKRYGWPAIDDSIDNLIDKGADYYLSVILDDADTKMIKKRFKTVKQTSSYVLINLNEPL